MTYRKLHDGFLETLAEALRRWGDAMQKQADRLEPTPALGHPPGEGQPRAAARGEDEDDGDAPAMPAPAGPAPQEGAAPPEHWLRHTAGKGPPAHWLARVRQAMSDGFTTHAAAQPPHGAPPAPGTPVHAEPAPAPRRAEAARKHPPPPPEAAQADVPHGGTPAPRFSDASPAPQAAPPSGAARPPVDNPPPAPAMPSPITAPPSSTASEALPVQADVERPAPRPPLPADVRLRAAAETPRRTPAGEGTAAESPPRRLHLPQQPRPEPIAPPPAGAALPAAVTEFAAPPERAPSRPLPLPAHCHTAAPPERVPLPERFQPREQPPPGAPSAAVHFAPMPPTRTRRTAAFFDAPGEVPSRDASGGSLEAGVKAPGMFQAETGQAHWPALPAGPAAEDDAAEDRERILRALQRRQRLDREQQGALWSA